MEVKAKPQMPKCPKKRRDVLSRTEITRLEEAVPTERDRLVIRILGECGLRGAVLGVDGKGRRQRRSPPPPAVLRRIERHIQDLKTDDPERRLTVRCAATGSGSTSRSPRMASPSSFRRKPKGLTSAGMCTPTYSGTLGEPRCCGAR